MSSRAKPAKRIIVVLGMHRSGTSAIARGLKALGVELGERLMPPAAGNNEKGFWEDVDANTLDNDLLKHLGHSWDSLGPIDPALLSRDDIDPFRLRAVELLQEKLSGVTVFGMKDPRIARLLPFWKLAFERVGADVGYVISTRHPLSVARSLSRRDGMGAEKSHYLWLDHVAACMTHSKGSPRVVVDYDLLMEQPETQLRRIANAMGLPFEPSSAGFREYAKEFLADELRHSEFALGDLKQSRELPGELVEVAALLHRMARDEASPDAPDAGKLFARVIHVLEDMRPAFRYINRNDVELEDLRKSAAEKGERIAYLEHVVAVRDTHVVHLEGEVAKRDGHIAELQKIAGELEKHIASLNHIVGDREERIDALNREVAGIADTGNRVIGRLRAGLAGEMALARESAAAMGTLDFKGSAVPGVLLEARAGLERYAEGLDRHCRALESCKTESADLPGILAAIEQLAPAQRETWGRAASAAGLLGISLVESAHELEINRLRLADTLRQVSRDEDRIARLKVTVTELQDLLARREAEIRARDGVIAERQAQVERLDGILGQVGHRLVSRIGKALAPYPALRAAIRAPLRVLQRLVGQTGS